jgi:hypothetical protein
MSDRTVVTPLTDDEWEMIGLLRDVPDGPLHLQLMALVRQLAAFVASPGCPRSQADGVPCPTAQASCEECQRVDACLSHMSLLLRSPEARACA